VIAKGRAWRKSLAATQNAMELVSNELDLSAGVEPFQGTWNVPMRISHDRQAASIATRLMLL
jgi:hypothetical protein